MVGAAGVESGGGRGGGVEAAQDHSGGRRAGAADGEGGARGRRRTVGVEEWGIWRAREGGRRQCEGNKYVDSNGAPPPGAP